MVLFELNSDVSIFIMLWKYVQDELLMSFYNKKEVFVQYKDLFNKNKQKNVNFVPTYDDFRNVKSFCSSQFLIALNAVKIQF